MFSQIKLTNPPVYQHYRIKYSPKDFCPDKYITWNKGTSSHKMKYGTTKKFKPKQNYAVLVVLNNDNQKIHQ